MACGSVMLTLFGYRKEIVSLFRLCVKICNTSHRLFFHRLNSTLSGSKIFITLEWETTTPMTYHTHESWHCINRTKLLHSLRLDDIWSSAKTWTPAFSSRRHFIMHTHTQTQRNSVCLDCVRFLMIAGPFVTVCCVHWTLLYLYVVALNKKILSTSLP